MVRLLRILLSLSLAAQGVSGQEVGPPLPPPDALSRALQEPAPDRSTLPAVMALLDETLAYAREGAFARAAEGFDELGKLAPTLMDWTPLFQAEAMAELGDTVAVAALLDRLGADSEVRSRWGWLPEARALEVADEPGRGADVARRAAETPGPSSGAALAWLRVGQLSAASGDTASARGAFGLVLNSSVTSRYAELAADGLVDLRDLAPEELYAVARVRIVQGVWSDAVPGLEAADRIEGLGADERREARLNLGRAYFYTRRYRDAESVLRTLADDSMATPGVAARALYFTGRSVYRLGRTDEGRHTLQSVAEKFPDSSAATDALYLLADLDHDAGHLEAAEGYYGEILELAPGSTTADLAGIRLGGLRYLHGDHEEAAAVFDRRRAEAGDLYGRQQAAYWAGLAYEALERADTATARFREAYESDPLSYYGTQAAARIGAPLLAPGLPGGPETPDRAGLDGALMNAIVRLQVHAKVPTPGSLDFELRRLKRHFAAFPGGKYALAETMIEGGLPVQGILLGRELQRESDDGWNLRLLRIVYPFPHRDVIVREAERRNVNPYLAAGIIRQESMFDEDVKSRAGAIGMMQVMPATGRQLARDEGIRPYSTTRLTEAEVNVILGMSFLSEMLRRYHGAVLDALIAYNAGPTRIRRWRDMPEYRDRALFTERIPFRETREYVKIVQQNALIYATLYGCGDGGDPCLGESPSPVLGLLQSTGSDTESLR